MQLTQAEKKLANAGTENTSSSSDMELSIQRRKYLFREKIARQLCFTSRTSTLTKFNLWQPEEEELRPARQCRIKIPQTPSLLFGLAVATGKCAGVPAMFTASPVLLYKRKEEVAGLRSRNTFLLEASWWKATFGWRSVSLPGHVEKRTSSLASELHIIGHVLSGAKDFCLFLPWKLPAGMLEVCVMCT